MIKNGNKNRFITIKPRALKTYEEFLDKLTLISSGMMHGSDAMDLNEDSIDFNNITVMYK